MTLPMSRAYLTPELMLFDSPAPVSLLKRSEHCHGVYFSG